MSPVGLLPALHRYLRHQPQRASSGRSVRPLTAPPAPNGPTDKVLWIPRTTPLPANPRQVVITAQLDGTDWTARVVLPDGFGPSTVDLPAPGCWHRQVIAGADTVELDLTYGGDPTATTATSGTS